MYVDIPGEKGYFQTIFWCEHGEWATQSEAWSDHELSNNTLTPNVNQAVTLSAEIRYQDLTEEQLQAIQASTQAELDRRETKELPTKFDV